MTIMNRPQPHAFTLTVRLIQGYRYLDLCGETLIKLEEQLDTNWIPGEVSPSRGLMKNEVLGMTAAFGTEALQITQSEYFDFSQFLAAASTIYETIWKTLRIVEVNAPSFRVVYQQGFEKVEDAEKYVQSAGLCTPSSRVSKVLGGDIIGTSYAFVTMRSPEWMAAPVSERRRLEVKSVRQERRQTIDDRLVSRAKLLPQRQQEAMQSLMLLRGRQPTHFPAAAQFDLEQCYETVFRTATFPLAKFLEESHSWAGSAIQSFCGGELQ